MDVRPIDESELEGFFHHQPATAGLFLQTAAWGRFEENLGNKGERLGFWHENRLVGTALIVGRSLPAGLSYAYVARGPVVDGPYLSQATEALVLYCKDKRVVFLRIEPPVLVASWSPLPSSFVRAPDVQPRATTVVDLRQPTGTLLGQMHEKTRYNIRLSERKELTWRWQGARGWEGFYQLLRTTAERDGFTLHPKSHYQKLLELYGAVPLVAETDLAIRVAEVSYGGELLAANLLAFSHGTVTYLHGASGNTLRELMPTYLLHWRTMAEAQALGFGLYDFWGVAPADGSKSSWQGISRFKLGFGGKRQEYPGAFDYPYHSALYRLYGLARQARRLLLRL